LCHVRAAHYLPWWERHGQPVFYLAIIPFALLLIVLPMLPALIRLIGKGCLGGTLEGPLGSLFFQTFNNLFPIIF
jgi:hypothetical protein